MQVQNLLEKSKKLKSKAEALLQEMGESREYWKIRLLESERWLLARNVDDFQEDLMKLVAHKLEEARPPARNPNNVWIETHKARLLDPTTLKRVNRYIFSAVIIKDLKIGSITMSRMMKEEDIKFLKVESFETVVRELKKEIMEGKKDNLLRDPVEKILYNSIPTTPPPDRTLHRKTPQKKGISQYGYKRIPEPENVYKRIPEPEKNTG